MSALLTKYDCSSMSFADPQVILFYVPPTIPLANFVYLTFFAVAVLTQFTASGLNDTSCYLSFCLSLRVFMNMWYRHGWKRRSLVTSTWTSNCSAATYPTFPPTTHQRPLQFKSTASPCRASIAPTSSTTVEPRRGPTACTPNPSWMRRNRWWRWSPMATGRT